MVKGPSGRAGSGRGAIRQSQNWSGGLPAGPEVVGGPPASTEVVRGPFGRADSGLGAQNWSMGPLTGPELAGGPSSWAGSGQGALWQG